MSEKSGARELVREHTERLRALLAPLGWHRIEDVEVRERVTGKVHSRGVRWVHGNGAVDSIGFMVACDHVAEGEAKSGLRGTFIHASFARKLDSGLFLPPPPRDHPAVEHAARAVFGPALAEAEWHEGPRLLELWLKVGDAEEVGDAAR